MRIAELYQALRQRRIVQTLIVYLGGSWGILQALSLFQQTYSWPRAVMDVALYLLACGFVLAETIAWFHGERGHQRVPPTEVVIVGLVVLVAAVGGWGLAVRPQTASSDAAEGDAARTLAVMPFVNSTGDTALVWLQRGMVEMLSTDLAQRPQLHVVSGERVFDLLRQQGAGRAAIIAEPVADTVALRANAGYVVRGAVFRSGRTLRLDAQLVKVADGTVAVSAHAVGPDVFALVDTLAARLAAELLAGIPAGPASPPPPAPLRQVATGSVAAFREYHAGLEAERQAHSAEALAFYLRALALDSTFPQALLHAGRLELAQGDFAAARLHLDRAANGSGNSLERERHFAGALLASSGQDLPAATRALERLSQRYRDDKEVWLWLARAYALDPARGAERERALRQVLRLDPWNGPAYADLADEMARRGQYARADSLALRYIALAPGEPEARVARAQILERAGRTAEARASYQAALQLRPDFPRALEHLARLDLRAGGPSQALADVAPYLRGGDATVQLRARLLTGDLLLWEGRVDAALAMVDTARQQAANMEPRWQDVALREALALWQLLGDESRVLRTLEGTPGGVERFLPQYAVALGELGRLAQLQALAQRIREEPPRPTTPPGPSAPPFRAGAPPSPSLQREPEAAAGSSRPQRLARGADVLAALAAYYRGDWSGAVAHFQAAAQSGAGPAEAPDPHFVLALLEAGRAAQALPLVQSLDSVEFGHAIPYHEGLYLQARVYEANGRAAAAEHAYQLLLRDWGSCIRRFPLLRDAPARMARLPIPPR